MDETAERVVVAVTRRLQHPAERMIWFLFFGWMAGLVLVAAAAVPNFTAIGYIFRPWALQQLPRVMRLAEPSQRIVGPPTPKEREQEVRERPYIGALYFFRCELVGRGRLAAAGISRESAAGDGRWRRHAYGVAMGVDDVLHAPLLVAFGADGVTSLAFDRRAGERTLRFEGADADASFDLVDLETGSGWVLLSGRR